MTVDRSEIEKFVLNLRLNLVQKTLGTLPNIFEHYMHKDNTTISRLDFENHLFNKKSDIVFNRDIQPLLSVDQRASYDHEKAYEIVLNKFVIKMKS